MHDLLLHELSSSRIGLRYEDPSRAPEAGSRVDGRPAASARDLGIRIRRRESLRRI